MSRPVRRRRDRPAGTAATGPAPYLARVASLRRLIDDLGRRDRPVRPADPRPAGPRPGLPGACRPSPGSARCWPRCSSPRSATCTGSPTAAQLASWAGLTPKHRESDTTRAPRLGSPSRAPGWCAGPRSSRCRALRTRAAGARRLQRRVGDRRGRNIGTVAAARKLLTWSTTRCATATSAPCPPAHARRPQPRLRRRRRERERS